MSDDKSEPILNAMNDYYNSQCRIGICHRSHSASLAEVLSKTTDDESNMFTSLINFVSNIFKSPNEYDKYINSITELSDELLDIALKHDNFSLDKKVFFDIVLPFLESRINRNQQNNDLIKICPNEDNKFNYFMYNNQLILWVLTKNKKKIPNPSIESRNIIYVEFRIKKIRNRVYEVEKNYFSNSMQ